ncbi:MAG TPA: sigma-70 family RNA polymerase sigma factor [Ferruginibacter sp.]|nr:sigma-70 family RNA polymerase sigma factor [Ferruginibacter sp.]
MPFFKNISPEQPSDIELVTAFKKSSDIKYVSNLYQRYMELVYGVCLKYFKDSEQSKDAVMDIFEELCRKLNLYEVTNFKSWLHVLAKNYCLMQLRSPKNIKSIEFNPIFMQFEQESHLEEEHLEKEENYARMEYCINKLAEEQKQTIRLFYLQHKCYNDIVLVTGYEWSKIRSHIQNGRRNLKKCMEDAINELRSKRSETR